MFLGVDTGGTFTDFVLAGPEGLRFHKVLSTPDNPALAIARGLEEMGLKARLVDLVHGSTVATNAILERKGVRTLFVTNRGLEDLLIIGRQQRRRLYDLCPTREAGWFSSADAVGVEARLDAEGREVAPLTEDDLARVRRSARDYPAVAVCLLFSFLDDGHERRIASALGGDRFVSLSSEVLPECGEYERAVTTWLNAYVGPRVAGYLDHLAREVRPRRLHVMHSGGGVMTADQAGRHAIRLALSGPAGGLVAAASVARELADIGWLPAPNLLSFDMGGTSTDVALIRGEPRLTSEAEVAGLPVAVPMLDIHTIGAGGGSIAWVDAAGLPQVGPESAGASPGPACYGLGGRKPTVTDANLALGYLPPDVRMAGSMPLDRDAALAALAEFGRPLGRDALEAARAVLAIADEHMAGALRVVSVQRGENPREYALCCFGGAGGLHACRLAEKLGMDRIVVPVASGAFSALGMLLAPRQMEFTQGLAVRLDAQDAGERIDAALAALRSRARREMAGLALSFEARAALHYEGQGFRIEVPLDDPEGMRAAFEQRHAALYGHRLDRPVRIASLRLTASAGETPLHWLELAPASAPARAFAHSEVAGIGRVPRFRRADLAPGHRIEGPALIEEPTATVWLAGGWRLSVAPRGHLLLEREERGDA